MKAETTLPRLEIATERHLPDLIRMSTSFHEISPYRDFPLNLQKTETFLRRVLDGPRDRNMPLALVSEGRAIGMILGAAGELPFSDVLFVEEVIWWIDPEYRGLRNANRMLEALEYWSQKIRASFIKLAHLEDENAKLLHMMYARRGYRLCESAYIKEI